jgi:uncharacterized protein (TIRG00374 family)
MNKRLRTILQYIFFMGLGIFLVWWSIKDLSGTDKSQIDAALRSARYSLLFPVVIVLISTHVIRALRWRLLIEPLGYKSSFANTLFAVFIGYLSNQAVPRLGEVLKCTVLARYEKIPTDKLIGTIILERVIDTLTLLLVFGITVIIQPQLYSQLTDAIFNSSGEKEEKKIASWVLGLILIAIVGIVVGLWMFIKKKTINDVVELIKKIWLSVMQGISSIKHLKKRKQFIFLSIILWGLYLAGGYIGFMAFKETEHYGFREAFTVLSAGSIGMIITPGGIGAYALLIEKTMQIYGLQKGIALAFGWVLWLAQTGVILIGGLFSFAALPYFNKKKQREQS